MRCIKQIIVYVFAVCMVTNTFAQNQNDSGVGDIIVGAGINMVDDGWDGNPSNFFKGNTKNISNPFIFNGAYRFLNDFTLAGSLSFNTYKIGKGVDGRVVSAGAKPHYFALDLSVQYNFIKTNTIKPYLMVGMGVTRISKYTATNLPPLLISTVNIPTILRPTLNIGFGTNYWFNQNWGVHFEVIAFKKGLHAANKIPNYVSSQTQIAITAVYAFRRKTSYRSRIKCYKYQ